MMANSGHRRRAHGMDGQGCQPTPGEALSRKVSLAVCSSALGLNFLQLSEWTELTVPGVGARQKEVCLLVPAHCEPGT